MTAETMPAISLHQPWGGLIFLPGPDRKLHETRHWRYPERLHGQRIAIHAAKRQWRLDDVPLELRRGAMAGVSFHFGGFLGTVVLDGCFSTNDYGPHGEVDRLAGNWSPDRFAWRLADIRPLEKPVPALGRQGWWTINPAILEN